MLYANEHPRLLYDRTGGLVRQVCFGVDAITIEWAAWDEASFGRPPEVRFAFPDGLGYRCAGLSLDDQWRQAGEIAQGIAEKIGAEPYGEFRDRQQEDGGRWTRS